MAGAAARRVAVDRAGLITTVIGHDMYHAGEVNHLRSVLEGDDRWAFERDG